MRYASLISAGGFYLWSSTGLRGAKRESTRRLSSTRGLTDAARVFERLGRQFAQLEDPDSSSDEMEEDKRN